MGDASTADYNGLSVSRFPRAGKVDLDKLAQDHGITPVQLDSYRGRATQQVRMTTK